MRVEILFADRLCGKTETLITDNHLGKIKHPSVIVITLSTPTEIEIAACV